MFNVYVSVHTHAQTNLNPGYSVLRWGSWFLMTLLVQMSPSGMSSCDFLYWRNRLIVFRNWRLLVFLWYYITLSRQVSVRGICVWFPSKTSYKTHSDYPRRLYHLILSQEIKRKKTWSASVVQIMSFSAFLIQLCWKFCILRCISECTC